MTIPVTASFDPVQKSTACPAMTYECLQVIHAERYVQVTAELIARISGLSQSIMDLSVIVNKKRIRKSKSVSESEPVGFSGKAFIERLANCSEQSMEQMAIKSRQLRYPAKGLLEDVLKFGGENMPAINIGTTDKDMKSATGKVAKCIGDHGLTCNGWRLTRYKDDQRSTSRHYYYRLVRENQTTTTDQPAATAGDDPAAR